MGLDMILPQLAYCVFCLCYYDVRHPNTNAPHFIGYWDLGRASKLKYKKNAKTSGMYFCQFMASGYITLQCENKRRKCKLV